MGEVGEWEEWGWGVDVGEWGVGIGGKGRERGSFNVGRVGKGRWKGRWCSELVFNI